MLLDPTKSSIVRINLVKDGEMIKSIRMTLPQWRSGEKRMTLSMIQPI